MWALLLYYPWFLQMQWCLTWLQAVAAFHSVMGRPLTVKFPMTQLYLSDLHKYFPFLTDKKYWSPSSSHCGFMYTGLRVTCSSYPWVIPEPELQHKPINREGLFQLELEVWGCVSKQVIPKESELPLLQRIHLSLGAVSLPCGLCYEGPSYATRNRVFLPGFPCVFSQSFQNLSHFQRMKCPGAFCPGATTKMTPSILPSV